MVTLAFLALVVTQVADILTTKAVLAAGGVEKNPLMLKLSKLFGGNMWLPAIALKVALLAAVFFLPFPQPIVWGMAGIFGAVSGWNFLKYREQLKFNKKK